MKVALCILTYNSARDLECILSKAINYFDDALILDGGSQDETTEVAEKYGARIFYQETNGFPGAEGRNFLDNNTLADYVLVWDTDEDFPQDFLKNIQNIIELNHLCYRFPRINLPDWFNFPDYQVRLYRKKDCKWARCVHEILIDKRTGKPADQVDCIPLYRYPIIHLPEPLYSRLDKFKRDMFLLLKERNALSEDLIREIDSFITMIKNRYENQTPKSKNPFTPTPK